MKKNLLLSMTAIVLSVAMTACGAATVSEEPEAAVSSEVTSTEETTTSTETEVSAETIESVSESAEEIADAFSADVYQEFKNTYSLHCFYSAYNGPEGLSMGEEVMEESENGWNTFTELTDEWGIQDKIAGLTDFTSYDELSLMSSSSGETYYSDKAYICTSDDVTVELGYGDLNYASDGDGFVHSGNYYSVTILITIGEDNYSFYFENLN